MINQINRKGPTVTMPISWMDNPSHWAWLAQRQDELLNFYAGSAADFEGGGFWWLDSAGEPLTAQGKQLWVNARMTYTFAIGHLLGRPGSARLVEHGIGYLSSGAIRDAKSGGWFWALDEDNTPSDDSKQAYGHSFVLLAASAALIAGFEQARPLFNDALATLNEKFWSEEERMFVDTWNRDFSKLSSYRGQNANMHLVEALMVAAELTGEVTLLKRAESIAERLIRDVSGSNEWRLPEHFDSDWSYDLDFNKDDPANLFRPYGSTVGHLLEWARLLVQLNAALPTKAEWIPAAAANLFERAVADGWDLEQSGLVCSTDWNGTIVNGDRYHWVIAEAIGAAVAMYRSTGNVAYSEWYARFWDHAAAHTIDTDGSWRHELDSSNTPISVAWLGKPDLYHALQATLFARTPIEQSIISSLAEGALDGRPV